MSAPPEDRPRFDGLLTLAVGVVLAIFVLALVLLVVVPAAAQGGGA